jgi:hypothetical protein
LSLLFTFFDVFHYQFVFHWYRHVI